MLLNLPLVLETRRNHALEHATLHVLAGKYRNQTMAGHSNPSGFFLLGDFRTEDVNSAAAEALARLKAGESGLAIHPGCGTNLAAAALLPATFAWAPLRAAKSTRWRLLLIPFALAFALFGYFLSQPLGPWLQRHITTEADLGDMQIADVVFVRKGVHRVVTR
ncbi:MAG: DUF6391 domain-containing protein [Chloroflexota bacterium]|nr:hypothetical protein [Chloroflexota bacterium]MBI5704385.1 hypothetical protein [Chloroflexota bacterium]